MTAPWEEPDSKAAWDQHAAETYYYYWEQYSFWAGQGWTAEQSFCNGNTGGEATAGGMEGKTHSEGRRDRETGAESQQREEVKALHDDVEVLNDLLGQNCVLEAGGSIVTGSGTDRQPDGDVCASDDPSDGGKGCKRPAASSHKHNTAQHAGNICECMFVCV